jgi:hypothetical protein
MEVICHSDHSIARIICIELYRRLYDVFAFSKVFTYRYLLSAHGQSLPLAGIRSSAGDEIHGNESFTTMLTKSCHWFLSFGPHDYGQN